MILSFTEQELRSIIETGEYSDPKSVDYMVRTLLERRDMIARYWLAKVDGLSNFSIQPTPDGVALMFHDLMRDHKLAGSGSTEFVYEVRGPHFKASRKSTVDTEIRISRAELAAAIERGGVDAAVEVAIWMNRSNTTSDPVKVYFQWTPSLSSFRIHRISRG